MKSDEGVGWKWCSDAFFVQHALCPPWLFFLLALVRNGKVDPCATALGKRVGRAAFFGRGGERVGMERERDEVFARRHDVVPCKKMPIDPSALPREAAPRPRPARATPARAATGWRSISWRVRRRGEGGLCILQRHPRGRRSSRCGQRGRAHTRLIGGTARANVDAGGRRRDRQTRLRPRRGRCARGQGAIRTQSVGERGASSTRRRGDSSWPRHRCVLRPALPMIATRTTEAAKGDDGLYVMFVSERACEAKS